MAQYEGVLEVEESNIGERSALVADLIADTTELLGKDTLALPVAT